MEALRCNSIGTVEKNVSFYCYIRTDDTNRELSKLRLEQILALSAEPIPDLPDATPIFPDLENRAESHGYQMALLASHQPFYLHDHRQIL